MAQTKIVLLEKIDNLGAMGDVVAVRPGYARNYLLPNKKALRATKENIAYFEAQRKHLESENDKRKAEAEKLAKKLQGLKVPLIRQASESGQLYGSVTARDIAQGVAEESKQKIDRHMVQLNQSYKMIGLFPVTLALHPEVKVEVTINIARTVEEAQTQAKTGKALIAEEGEALGKAEENEEQLSEMLDEEALAAKKEEKEAAKKKAAGKEEAEDELKAEAGEEKAEKKPAKKAAKKAKKAENEEEA